MQAWTATYNVVGNAIGHSTPFTVWDVGSALYILVLTVCGPYGRRYFDFQEEMRMKIFKTIIAVVALVLMSGAVATRVSADTHNKKTVMTFNQPIEIPGQVLPAGTYTFKLASSLSNRHIVQVWNADGTKIIATVLAINDYRLRPTGHTVVKFSETAGDAPEALKAWFFPGDNFGQEFVYPKTRASTFRR
jgi:heme/copper-type cytochrome/quinol oxidase subunit 1